MTDDGGAIVPIFPGGWKWIRVDGLRGGPLPTGNPKPIDTGEDDPEDGHKDEDEDDDDDDDEEECTTTAPPKCTLTLSYYTGEDGEGTSTRIGSCAPVTGCVSGKQSTTTTTIAFDVPRITGVLEKDNVGRDDIDLGPMEEDTVKYFAEMFKKWGISSNSTEAEPPKPSCDMYAYGADAECMELFSTSFCDTVEKDKNEAVSRNLTYEDIVGDSKRAVATGAEKNYRVSKKADSSSTTLPSATSQIKTKTAEPKRTTTGVKFEVHNLQCNNEDDFRGHADISSRGAKEVIKEAYSHSSHEDIYMTPDSKPYVKEFEDGDTHKHRVTWSWIEGCSMKNEKVSIWDPLDEGVMLGNYTRCATVMGDTWWDCNNGGVGGSEDVGCVRYKLDSGWSGYTEPLLADVVKWLLPVIKVVGPLSPSFIDLIRFTGDILISRSRLQEAIQGFELLKGAFIAIKSQQNSSPVGVECLNALCQASIACGEYEMDEALTRILISRYICEDEGGRLLYAILHLGTSLYFIGGKDREAVNVLEEASNSFTLILGDTHHDKLECDVRLAWALPWINEPSRALGVATKALRTVQEHYESIDTYPAQWVEWQCLGVQAFCQNRLGQASQAIQTKREELACRRRSNRDKAYYYEELSTFAKMLLGVNQLQEAETAVEEAICGLLRLGYGESDELMSYAYVVRRAINNH
ncbi:hypothetical protein FPHYL_233 [Fusarium phyllophilum]|uniref:Uncharacterized protein n=1 Tax=Fusarium phyllophilum TaxID=47803 RepID=A0A8H5KE90_9HYPO|nr:hypothetical protein FPHYL_233 [Fusarium phyllophilum]